jgi:hypothetical protein
MNGISVQYISPPTFYSLHSGITTWPKSEFHRKEQHLIYDLDILYDIRFWESVDSLLKLPASLKVKSGYFGLRTLLYSFQFAANKKTNLCS